MATPEGSPPPAPPGSPRRGWGPARASCGGWGAPIPGAGCGCRRGRAGAGRALAPPSLPAVAGGLWPGLGGVGGAAAAGAAPRPLAAPAAPPAAAEPAPRARPPAGDGDQRLSPPGPPQPLQPPSPPLTACRSFSMVWALLGCGGAGGMASSPPSPAAGRGERLLGAPRGPDPPTPPGCPPPPYLAPGGARGGSRRGVCRQRSPPPLCRRPPCRRGWGGADPGVWAPPPGSGLPPPVVPPLPSPGAQVGGAAPRVQLQRWGVAGLGGGPGLGPLWGGQLGAGGRRAGAGGLRLGPLLQRGQGPGLPAGRARLCLQVGVGCGGALLLCPPMTSPRPHDVTLQLYAAPPPQPHVPPPPHQL